jgi:hypothetical protein
MSVLIYAKIHLDGLDVSDSELYSGDSEVAEPRSTTRLKGRDKQGLHLTSRRS